MKREELYNTWKERKSQIKVSSAFSGKVMSRIYQYERARRRPLFDFQRFVDIISAHTLAKASLVAVGAAVGFVRLMFMILVILSRGDING
ncbi:hypothetical protein ES703_33147 [subsurface metagenome]